MRLQQKSYGNDEICWFLLSSIVSLLDVFQSTPELAFEGSVREMGVMLMTGAGSAEGARGSALSPSVVIRSTDDVEESFNVLSYELFTSLVNHCCTVCIRDNEIMVLALSPEEWSLCCSCSRGIEVVLVSLRFQLIITLYLRDWIISL